MKAYNLYGINNLIFENVEYPKLEKNWVIVKVGACGICSSDIPRIFSKGTYNFPTIPGHELSGRIYDVNEKDRSIKGKKVGIFPLIPCMKCKQCLEKKYEMCSNYDYIGSRRNGGFAQFVAVPKWNLIYMDEKIPYEIIATMEPLAVALHAVKRAKINDKSTVAIIGTGMIGIACAQWASKYSSDVTILGRTNEKKKIIDKIGGLKYKLLNETNEEYDIVIEAVGTAESLINSISKASPSGTIVLLGNPSGNITLPQEIYWKILRRQLNVIGTWNSCYDGDNPSDWMDVKEAIEKNTIKILPLITHKFKYFDLKQGLDIMKNHTESYCKVMTIWEGEDE